MIKYTTGNLLASDKDALINTVNLEGFMGKGIAYQFKKKFPENNKAYVRACKNNEIGIGKVFAFEEDGKIIINFPTKDKWRGKTKVEYITSGLISLKELIKEKNIRSIAIPPLGCGNGGLSWGYVKPLIENNLSDIQNNIDILIYEPSQDFIVKPKIAPKPSISHLLVLGVMKNLNFSSLMAIQKALFFMSIFARSTFFKFNEYKHGPYSHPIEIVIKQVKEYLEFYNFSDTKRRDLAQALGVMYNSITSKAVEADARHYAPYLKNACTLCNTLLKYDNGIKKLEICATIVHILSQKQPLSTNEIISSFFNYPKEDISIFGSDEIKWGIDFLFDNAIIQKDIFDNYSIV
ncbi:type II toxin-antitoxin system antitoxin DNA ADP-ribosyl glycohydrolase DarG [Campylobacter mucosalis]|uniref:type II toxin-antitoxin system antitoxin DNA ADP-ribosyl glycohydrolase DarG n=1 Tax=Campylobacter mucosalis TaxID=202 RepID=UPI00147053AF|nr:macro domain-containing protein [Campylobacter mucosalis]